MGTGSVPHLCLGTAFLAEATVIFPSIQAGPLLFHPLSTKKARTWRVSDVVRKNTNSLATSEGPSPVSTSLSGSRGSSRPPWRTRPAGPACESCIFCYKQGGAAETSSLKVKRICSGASLEPAPPNPSSPIPLQAETGHPPQERGLGLP